MGPPGQSLSSVRLQLCSRHPPTLIGAVGLTLRVDDAIWGQCVRLSRIIQAECVRLQWCLAHDLSPYVSSWKSKQSKAMTLP